MGLTKRHLRALKETRKRVLSSLWTSTISPELQREAVRRIGMIALAFVVVDGLFGLVLGPLDLYPAMELSLRDKLFYGVVVVLSVALFALSRTQRVSKPFILNLGYAYVALVGLFMALVINRMPWPAFAFPMWTPVGIWLFVFATMVPGAPLKVFAASLITAAMNPLSLLILEAKGYPVPAFDVAVRRFLPDLGAVFFALVLSQVAYRLGVQLTQAREMGSYQLVERLGVGGMGEVWRAEHRMLARPAAVKLIRPERVLGVASGQAETVIQRFEREAQATATLSSPHTVAIYDFGTTDSGTFFYVMELLDGLDLESLVERFGPVPPERAVAILSQACRSLHEAHSRGLIHRDIKPANLFVCRHGGLHDIVKVLDFGLVKPVDPDLVEGSPRLTREGAMAGTPAFIAPEQALGDVVTASVDLYALGCVGYWLLTGCLVFEGKSALELVMQHVQGQPQALSAKSELPVPGPLEAVIMGCLAKKPDDRPRDAREVAAKLEAIDMASVWDEERAALWWQRHLPTPLPQVVSTSNDAAATLVERPAG